MRPLTTDLPQEDCQQVLANGLEYVRLRLVGKMLREARDTDVWRFISPREVAQFLPLVSRRLGRRAAFWQFLNRGWICDGLLNA